MKGQRLVDLSEADWVRIHELLRGSWVSLWHAVNS
jgi:hypothetical protein